MAVFCLSKIDEPPACRAGLSLAPPERTGPGALRRIKRHSRGKVWSGKWGLHPAQLGRRRMGEGWVQCNNPGNGYRMATSIQGTLGITGTDADVRNSKIQLIWAIDSCKETDRNF